MKIAFHKSTTPNCGSVGPIAYDKGVAWSVNVYPTGSGPDKYKVTDWRYELTWSRERPHRCAECERHIVAAEQEKS